MSILKSTISLISFIFLCIDAHSDRDLRLLQFLEDDNDDFVDPVIYDPIQEVSVFEPGEDAFVTVPQDFIRNAMMTTYGSTFDTVQRREESMTTPLVNLYNDSLFDDLWIKEYGSSGTYQLSYPVTVPQSDMAFVTRLTERCSYMSYFKENLLIVGAWSFCPGPPWRDNNLTEVHRFCFFLNYSMPSQPWINPNLGVPQSYPRGAVGSSQDGGKTWKIIVADPRLARLGSNLVIVNGSDGTNGAALCLVGGTILPPYQIFIHNSVFPITDSVLCSYDGITWWENTPLPTPSAEHSLASIGSSILVVGGLRPRNMSQIATLSVYTKFMTQPPILVSVLSSSPCNVGYPVDSACIGYKGWAAFASPLVPSVNNLPRCTPLVLFTSDISVPRSISSILSLPTLFIGSGSEMYSKGNPILILDNFLDMYTIKNESLAFNIIDLAIKTFDLDPIGGTRDTFNTSSFVKLGDWVQDERELPQTQAFENSFVHQIKFDPEANICLSNGIFPGACKTNLTHVFSPLLVYIRGQSLYSDFISTSNDFSLSPYKYFSVTQLLEDRDYIQDLFFRLETFYGQRVTTLPNYGSAFISFMNSRVTDSVLISPSWNDGQPLLLALQGGVRMQAIHFARCTFLNCKYGAAYPVPCQHNPRDSFCQPCESCTGNTSVDGGTFSRRQCTYDVSVLSRIPIVTETVCDSCTNCSAQDEDYSQTCSVVSDAVCKTRTISPSNVPSPIIDSKSDEYWRTWLFRIIPLERQSGPFLERLRTRPLEIGGVILAVVTLAFVLSISRILTLSEPSSSYRNYTSTPPQTSLSHENSTFKSHHIQITADEDTTIPTSDSSVTYDSKNKVQPPRLVSLSQSTKKHRFLKSACLAYTGIVFFVTSTTLIVSLPLETLTISLLIVIHSFIGFCGIYASGMLDMILDRGGKRRLAYSHLESPLSLDSRRYLRLAEFIVLLFMICSPLCINLVYFFPKDLIDIKQGEVFAYVCSFCSSLFQLSIICVSVYQNQLSLFLWPVSLSIIVTITAMICVGSVASTTLSQYFTYHYSTKALEKSVKSSDSVTSVSTDDKCSSNTMSEKVVTHSSGQVTESTVDIYSRVNGSVSSGKSTETFSNSILGLSVSSTVQNTNEEDDDNDDDDDADDSENAIDSKLVLDQLRNFPDLKSGEVVTSYSQQLEFEKDIQAILSEHMQKQQAIKQSQLRRASAPAVV